MALMTIRLWQNPKTKIWSSNPSTPNEGWRYEDFVVASKLARVREAYDDWVAYAQRNGTGQGDELFIGLMDAILDGEDE